MESIVMQGGKRKYYRFRASRHYGGIVTADAVPAIRHIHDRMPAVLSVPEADRWLDPANHDVAALGRLLAERETQAFLARPVSRRVNDARNEGPELVEPVDPSG
jgi:putative SOS response-associated peptidase YedK